MIPVDFWEGVPQYVFLSFIAKFATVGAFEVRADGMCLASHVVIYRHLWCETVSWSNMPIQMLS